MNSGGPTRALPSELLERMDTGRAACDAPRPIDKPQGIVPGMLDEISGKVSLISENLQELEARLSTVLGPASPPPVEKTVPAPLPGASTMVQVLGMVATDVEQLRRRVRGLIERVEL